ncbi:MAG TPA: VanZ family protein [Rhodocyclaceae bacterium]|nr:VanZ family protein [Rhodocyclaceae bacterium]
MPTGQSTALARSLAIAYTVLVVYASLHPFTGWTDSGVPLFAFLSADWPRYYTRFDLAVNVLAYVPLGFLWFPVVAARLGKNAATLILCILLSGLSGTLETIQNFLPSRVPSNVDLASNTLGVLLGTLFAQRWGSILLSESRLLRWRHRHLAHEPFGDYGLVLVGIWLLIQLSPENLLFGAGNLRQLLELPAALPFDAERFSRLEGLIAVMGTLSIALLLSIVLKRVRYWHLLLLIAAAAAIRSFASALLIAPDDFDHWITASNLRGVGLGLVIAWPALYLKSGARQTLAALIVMATTGLVNIAPDNPYLLQAAQVWQQGHFLNFNGLTRVVSTLWPFMVIVFLMRRPGQAEVS